MRARKKAAGLKAVTLWLTPEQVAEIDSRRDSGSRASREAVVVDALAMARVRGQEG